MKRFLFVLSTVLFALPPVHGQTGEWTAYLAGDLANEAGASIDAVLAGIDLREESEPMVRDALVEAHVASRRDSLSQEQRRVPFDSVLDGEEVRQMDSALEEIETALAQLSQVVREEPPPAGSSDASAAEQWFTALNQRFVVPLTAVGSLIRTIRQAGQNTPSSTARSFIESLGIPVPAAYEAASAQDQMTGVCSTWWLLFLAAPDDLRRASLLSDLADAAVVLSADDADAADELAAWWRERNRHVESLTRAARNSIHILTPRTLAAVARAQGESTPAEAAGEPAEEPFVDLLRLILRSSRDELVRAATLSPAVAFAVERSERLLASLTDYHAALVASRLQAGPALLRRAAHTLYRVRLDLVSAEARRTEAQVGAALRRFQSTNDYRAERELLDAYTSDARVFAEGLAPWVSGDERRAGDSYRWAMLSVLSNRSAQQRILDDPERSAEQRLLGEFVVSLYSGMTSRLDAAIASRLARDPSSDTADSYDRTYSLVPAASDTEQEPETEADVAADAEDVYQAFVAEAQGQGSISDLFSSGATGLTASSDWAHTHGFHVAEEGEESSAVWFGLADRSENELQGFSHQLRGLLRLGGRMENILEPSLRAAGRPDLVLHDARLDAALRQLSVTREFTVTPGETLTVLFALFPDADSPAGLIDLLLTTASITALRIDEVDGADSRALDFLLGVP